MLKQIVRRTAALCMSVLLCSFVTTPIVQAVSSPSRVEALVQEMTVRDKITQMLEVDFRKWNMDADSNSAEDFTVMNEQVHKIVKDYNFGAVIYFSNNIKETQQAFELTMALQDAATSDRGIPMLICVDQEGGSVYRLGSGTALPGNMALGATRNPSYAKQAGEIIGSELSVLGINTALAPVVDVNSNANNPVIGLRSYSDLPEVVGEMASAAIDGMAAYHVIGCAKHFPGHGDTETDSHYGLPIVNKSKDDLLKNELLPFQTAIDQGIEMIMTAHILYPQLDSSTVVSNKTGNPEQLPATMSKIILTDLLKEEMGFNGIVSTDAMNMAGITNTFDQVQAVKQAIIAGADLICMPCRLYSTDDLKDLDAIISGVEQSIESGEIPISRLDDAVTRILSVKEKHGILDWSSENYSLDLAEKTVGCADNRSAERLIASKAVTVIKNRDNVLPLDITQNSRVLMLTPYANEQSQMVMGWNRAKDAWLIPDGSEVKVLTYTSESTVESMRTDLDWADTYIINSELSRSSMYQEHWLHTVPEALVSYGHQAGKTTVVMSVDKPYDVQFYKDADAILAVYGCKGSSIDVTEALLGGVTSSRAAYGPNIVAGIEVALGTFGASGKLPIDIPHYDSAMKTYTDEILYPRGYGLTYEAKRALPFTDVSADDWFYDSVAYVYRNQLMAGTGDTTFAPNDSITRGQFAAILWRLAGTPTVNYAMTFTDIPESAYYAEAVRWAASQGISNGYHAERFGPDDVITREQLSAMLYRYVQKIGGGFSGAWFFPLSYRDTSDISSWAYEPLCWMTMEGILQGNDGKLLPKSEATRAQVSAMMTRFLQAAK